MPPPSRRDLAIDLLLFAGTVAVAAWQKWQTTDLLWGLWASSLLVGYSFILTVSISMAFRKDGDQTGEATQISGDRATSPGPRHGAFNPAMLPQVVFLVIFFTIHFGGFHFGHSIFMSIFFPLTESASADGTLWGVPVWWFGLIGTCVRLYWPFILFSAVSQRVNYVRAATSTDDRIMIMPYKNVVRMHILIFVFAFLSVVGLRSFVLYVVLVFYFFPIGSLLRYREA